MVLYTTCVIIWIYLLSVFKRQKLSSFYFIVGSVGMFSFLTVGFLDKLLVPLSRIMVYTVSLLKPMFPVLEAYPEYNMIFINGDIPISLYINFECSGILEMLIFVSSLTFFVAYTPLERFMYDVIGVIYLFAANVLRIVSIILIVNYFGADSYYIAHTIVGKWILWVLAISLYFFIFTRHQILTQKVGEFSYDT